MNSVCHIDFETKCAIDIKEAGSDVYAQSPSCDALCLAYSFDDEPIELWIPGMPDPERLLEHVRRGWIVKGHNIGGFEMLIWNNVMTLKYGWPEMAIEQCRCTMAMAYAMGLPGSLDDASRALGIPYEKDMKGHRIMLKLSQPRAFTESGEPIWWTPQDVPDDFNHLYAYCKNDVLVEKEIDKRMLKLSPSEQKLWELDFKINRRGVYVDLTSAKLAISLVESEKDRINKRIREITGNQVGMASAVGQISQWIKAKGIDVPSLAKADVVEMLSRPDLPPDVRQVLLLRQEAAKTSTAKLDAMMKGASIGGRTRGLFQYHGASTGRWAGRRVQLQNLPRPKLKQEQIEKYFQILNRYGAKSGSYISQELMTSPIAATSDAIRGFLKAAPGKDFIAADFSAIEARVVAWLAGQESTLTVFREDGRIYELTAAQIYGGKVDDIQKDDPRRQVGKVAVLALGFQGGVGALQTMARGYGVQLEPAFPALWGRATDEHKRMAKFVWDLNGKKHDISQKEFVASDLVKQYWREANPMIVQYWADLNRAAICAVESPGRQYTAGHQACTYKMQGSFLWCKLPSGRVLCYPYPRIEMRAPFEDSDKKPTLTCMGVDSYTKKWMRYPNYGGLLAENNTQAIARDLLAEAIFRLEARDYPVVMHVHDETVSEVFKGFGSVEEVEDIMSQVPPWANGLPVEVEGWRNERFKK